MVRAELRTAGTADRLHAKMAGKRLQGASYSRGMSWTRLQPTEREGAERGLGVAGKGGGTRWRWMLGTGLGRDTRERELVEWGERQSKGGRSRGEGGQM